VEPSQSPRNAPEALDATRIPLLRESSWQMLFGERAAIEGILSQLRPALAIELGTAQGGSLERIAFHSGEVHTFDLIEPPLDRERFPNVTFHVGDSHELLARVLEELQVAGRNVDFVLVDGDHSAEGVRQDLEELLTSTAVANTVIVMHDTMNENVRSGIEEVGFEAFPKVAYVELDFVAGHMFREPSLRHELWGGLGLVLVDAARLAYFSSPVRQDRYYETYDLLRHARDLVVSREAANGNGG
jgi:Methyltransferase domain